MKERICSCFPLRVDPISESYLIKKSEQECMQVSITVLSRKRKGMRAFFEMVHLLGLIGYGLTQIK